MEEENMEEWKERVRQDINDVKQRQQQNEGKLSAVVSDIHRLETNVKIQDKEIEGIKNSLDTIQSDTRWIRRAITGAIITAVIGGFISVLISNLF